MPNALPGLLGEIEEVVGRKAALQLAIAVGGTRVYIPAHPVEDHWMVETIGMPAAKKLSEHFTFGRRGINLDIPKIPLGEQIQTLDEDGRSSREIALQLGIHQRTVHAHRRSIRKSRHTKS